MQAFLLAAGFGSRLAPITNNMPKCLVPINERPLLSYWLDILGIDLVTKIFINTHYLSHQVEKFVSSHPLCNKIQLINEINLLGTGGSLIASENYLDHNALFVAHADNISIFNLNTFFEKHRNRDKNIAITMMTFESDEPQNCGIVETNAAGIVINFHEKVEYPPSNLANAAVYIMEWEVIEFAKSLSIKKGPILDISNDLIPQYLGRIQTFINKDYHRDIGNPESLRKANIYFEKK